MKKKRMKIKKSKFLLKKCAGCGKPFRTREVCHTKDRPHECEYCQSCLTFKHGSELLLDNMNDRLDKMQLEINRLYALNEFYDEN